MSEHIPSSHTALLDGPYVVVLATVMPDGQPQVTPVWCNRHGEQLWVNSAKGRQKDRNMRTHPKVTVTVVDPQDSGYWIEVRGTVFEIVEGNEADAHINELSQLYRGGPFDILPGQERCIYKIIPTRVNVGHPD